MLKLILFTIIIILLIRLYCVSPQKTNIDPLKEREVESLIRKYFKKFKNIFIGN